MRRINPETHIKRAIRDYLEWHHWMVVTLWQGAMSYKGLSDLFAIRDGRVVWVECKTPTGKLSSYQLEFQTRIKEHGGEYIVARSVEDIQHLGQGGIHESKPKRINKSNVP
jgi:Holliday junction resolvase